MHNTLNKISTTCTKEDLQTYGSCKFETNLDAFTVIKYSIKYILNKIINSFYASFLSFNWAIKCVRWLDIALLVACHLFLHKLQITREQLVSHFGIHSDLTSTDKV